MKRRINILKIFVLIFVLMIAVTACTQSKDPETSYNSTSGSQSSEASSSTVSTEINIKSNKQIVDAINNEIYGFYIINGDIDGDDDADFAMNEAEKLPDRYLGKITSEEDAKEKAEAAWMKIDGYEDTINEKPYEAKYYKEYDAWLIHGTRNAFGTDSSGREYETPGGVAYIIMRASNGEVLAVWGEA